MAAMGTTMVVGSGPSPWQPAHGEQGAIALVAQVAHAARQASQARHEPAKPLPQQSMPKPCTPSLSTQPKLSKPKQLQKMEQPNTCGPNASVSPTRIKAEPKPSTHAHCTCRSLRTESITLPLLKETYTVQAIPSQMVNNTCFDKL
ncbi:hypothetical protein ACFX1S_041219 [Malus domestica]